MIARTQSVKIDHLHLSDRDIYFPPQVLGYIHSRFFPRCNGNDFKGLEKAVNEAGILPYIGDSQMLFVAVKEPIEEKFEKFPSLEGTEIIVVPVTDSQFRLLTKELETHYYGS